MKSKMVWIVICLGLIILVGCGSTSTNYYYYYPDWTPDGKILCSKNRQVVVSPAGNFGGGGGSVSNTYYLTIMDADGSNERDIKSIGNSAKVAASPLGNYYAYAESDSNFIHVVTTSGVSVSDIDGGARMSSFDWSPNENEIIFQLSGSSEIYVGNRGGTSITKLNISGYDISWRNGDMILLNKRLSSISYEVVALSGTTKLEMAQYQKINGIDYNISRLNTNEVVFNGEVGIEKFFLNSPETNPVLLINRNDMKNIRLSPDGQKIIANGINASYRDTDIWLINIDGTGLLQLR